MNMETSCYLVAWMQLSAWQVARLVFQMLDQ